ncbi:MAG: UDP-N-acetylmuramate dehydrogenase [Candidatus Kaiserbacteria bacterium]|nr:UDP-N-acetylmuramate dehydrogenase [Candidatus Kaiserbacteria bacterium]
MRIEEYVSIAPFTTFHIGGEARFFIEAQTEKDIEEAIVHARERGLTLHPLGSGSNVLVPDEGVAGVVLKIALSDITFEDNGADTLLVAGAGARWEDVVDAAVSRGLFGIENLAGIPGTVGGAAVQNIGAYGAELADTFAYADVIDSVTGASRRLDRSEAAFSYRTSFFKMHRELIIARVALQLKKSATPNIAYPDLVRAQAEGASLATPGEIACAIRAIRAAKFPQSAEEGTAGSFFKNPIVSRAVAAELTQRFPGVPQFVQEDGTVKIPLAWLLDHALALKGFTKNNVRLYEKQPLVIVARAGARAEEVDAFARDVAERVHAATGITIEREVETFGIR